MKTLDAPENTSFGSPAALQNLPDLFALLAHDIRAPLSVVTGSLEELNHPDMVPPLTTDQRLLVGLIRRSEARLMRMAANLQCLSEGMTLPPPSTVIDLRSMVERVAQLARILDAHPLALNITQPPTPVWIRAGSTMLECALSNIFANAYAFAKTAVSVSLASTDGLVALEVTDDGVGFSDDLIESTLGCLRSVDGRRQPGVGIGLVVVDEVVRLYGGTIKLSNRAPERGARVRVELPEAQPAS